MLKGHQQIELPRHIRHSPITQIDINIQQMKAARLDAAALSGNRSAVEVACLRREAAGHRLNAVRLDLNRLRYDIQDLAAYRARLLTAELDLLKAETMVSSEDMHFKIEETNNLIMVAHLEMIRLTNNIPHLEADWMRLVEEEDSCLNEEEAARLREEEAACLREEEAARLREEAAARLRADANVRAFYDVYYRDRNAIGVEDVILLIIIIVTTMYVVTCIYLNKFKDTSDL